MVNDPDAKKATMVCVSRFVWRTPIKNNFKIKNPQNINQLFKELGFDYRSIKHHIRILEKII